MEPLVVVEVVEGDVVGQKNDILFHGFPLTFLPDGGAAAGQVVAGQLDRKPDLRGGALPLCPGVGQTPRMYSITEAERPVV